MLQYAVAEIPFSDSAERRALIGLIGIGKGCEAISVKAYTSLERSALPVMYVSGLGCLGSAHHI
ncbi:hypothetical protein [Desulfosarcina ovata]|uniref:Uncharacterized protein n=1 Tax=Desulfosarcina ovata subsp. ovata TaxID=2752305 RepID=A0A5K8ADT6_9BACT|nr:hypothetical protein [Desulfosarcina ovata]BBO90731.1 hypothetical protein DSCOOX_39110 [Desulfosarcina ovata subsp. ovata]